MFRLTDGGEFGNAAVVDFVAIDEAGEGCIIPPVYRTKGELACEGSSVSGLIIEAAVERPPDV